MKDLMPERAALACVPLYRARKSKDIIFVRHRPVSPHPSATKRTLRGYHPQLVYVTSATARTPMRSNTPYVATRPRCLQRACQFSSLPHGQFNGRRVHAPFVLRCSFCKHRICVKLIKASFYMKNEVLDISQPTVLPALKIIIRKLASQLKAL